MIIKWGWQTMLEKRLGRMTHSKPRWSRSDDDRILSRRIFPNTMQPRVPFGCSLRSIEIILGIIDPSLSSYTSVSTSSMYSMWDIPGTSSLGFMFSKYRFPSSSVPT